MGKTCQRPTSPHFRLRYPQILVVNLGWDMPKTSDTQAQIWNIENKIKKTISFNLYAENAESIAAILKSKQDNKIDLLKLYSAVFREFKIENKLVLTSNRFEIPFEKDFESYENLDEALFYFPAIKKYLTPSEIEYRIPLYRDWETDRKSTRLNSSHRL